MIGLLEHQIQTWDRTGEVRRRQIIERIRTTLKARIEKELGKRLLGVAGKVTYNTGLGLILEWFYRWTIFSRNTHSRV